MQINPVIIFINDRDTRREVRICIKRLGFTRVQVPDNQPQCFATLDNISDGLLIIDWQGVETSKILDYSRKGMRFEVRPILLIVEEPGEGFLSMLSDYHISGVHAGRPTSADIERHLHTILSPDAPVNRYKEAHAEINRARNIGDLRAAEKKLNELAISSPNNKKIVLEQISLMIESGHWEEAEAKLNSFLLNNSKIPRALHLKARCLMNKGNTEEASLYLKRSTLLNPLNSQRLIDFGESLLRLNRPKEARDPFMKALKVDPSSKKAKGGLGTTNMLLGNINEGLSFINELASDRERASVFNNSGVLAIKDRQIGAALKFYDLGIALINDRQLKAKLVFNKGLAFLKNQDKEAGINLLKEAIALDPSFGRAESLLTRVTNEAKMPTKKAVPEMFDDNIQVVDIDDMDELL